MAAPEWPSADHLLWIGALPSVEQALLLCCCVCAGLRHVSCDGAPPPFDGVPPRRQRTRTVRNTVARAAHEAPAAAPTAMRSSELSLGDETPSAPSLGSKELSRESSFPKCAGTLYASITRIMLSSNASREAKPSTALTCQRVEKKTLLGR